ncbi:MAG: 4-hydroxy-3-methylbut-2-enyl diphosphate reductase [Firmicutes bacterium]|nr:4-hydroxy-3-methylbut-2-enyl diphosphate reductase [Bacillota bacterium]
MKVVVCKSSGLCFGAKRAIDIAEGNPNSVLIGGPILRNPVINNRLEKDFGITIQPDYKKIVSKQKAIITAHGLPKRVEDELRNKGIDLVDSTCPTVKKVHHKVRELTEAGYYIVLFGDKKHPETIGHVGYANDNIFVVETVDEAISNIPSLLEHVRHGQKIALLAQTTKNQTDLLEISVTFKEKGVGHDLVDTTCSAVRERQKEVATLAKSVDVVIVVGGKASHNTVLLKTTASKYKPTYHIESADEINKDWFAGKKSCGLVGGVSCPEYLIDEVQKRLYAF